MDPFSDFLEYIINKLLTKGSFVRSSDNIIIGETMDMFTKSDDFFPRMEILIPKLKFDGYVDNARVDRQSFRFSIGAHFRRISDNVVANDMFTALKWGREIKSIISSLHDDKISGSLPCEGFIQMDGFPEIFFEHELYPRITSIIFIGEAEIELIDTFQ